MNPHPPLAGFPGVLICILVGAELLALLDFQRLPRIRCRQFAKTLLFVLCLAAPLTYYSGYWGAEAANRTFSVPEQVIAAHQGWGKFLLITLVPCLLLSLLESSAEPGSRAKSVLYAGYLAALFLAFAVALYTSYQGGMLVFEYGAGVSAPLHGLGLD